MKLPAALAVSVALVCATVLSLHNLAAAAATIAIFGFLIWLSDIGSNAPNKPNP